MRNILITHDLRTLMRSPLNPSWLCHSGERLLAGVTIIESGREEVFYDHKVQSAISFIDCEGGERFVLESDIEAMALSFQPTGYDKVH